MGKVRFHGSNYYLVTTFLITENKIQLKQFLKIQPVPVLLAVKHDL